MLPYGVGADSISARAIWGNAKSHGRALFRQSETVCQKASTLLYRECRGEHCSPAAISGNVRFHGSIWNAPLREPKRPPCVKGAGCAATQTEGLRPYGYNPTRPYTLQSLRHGLRRATRLRVGPLCRCATSPHTVGSHPLHKGGFVLAQPYWLIAYKKWM